MTPKQIVDRLDAHGRFWFLKARIELAKYGE